MLKLMDKKIFCNFTISLFVYGLTNGSSPFISGTGLLDIIYVDALGPSPLFYQSCRVKCLVQGTK